MGVFVESYLSSTPLALGPIIDDQLWYANVSNCLVATAFGIIGGLLTTKALRRDTNRALLILATIFSAPAIAHGQASALLASGEPTIADVTAAWALRTAAIQSVAITCEIEETVIGDGGKPRERFNHFTKAIPSKDRVLKATAEYAFENGKFAIKKSGDVINANDPEKIRPQVFHAAFDGQTNTSLLEERRRPMGSIDRTSTPAAKVIANLNFISLGLWIEPTKYLKHSGWSVGKMTLENDFVEVSGVQCRRIRIPRDPRLSATMDVDPKRGWLPVRWQSLADGKPSKVITIDYRLDEELGPVVSQWVVTIYNEGGKLASTRRARIIRLDLNADIDDSHFTIKFPLGTHVSENRRSGHRYYIQMPNDILMPIKESDYGRTKPL